MASSFSPSLLSDELPEGHENIHLIIDDVDEDDEYKRAEAIALSASQILSSQKTRSKSPLLITRKNHRPTPPVEILTDPEQRRLVEQSIHTHDHITESSGGGISLADATKKELQRLSVNVNKTVERIMDSIQMPVVTQPFVEVDKSVTPSMTVTSTTEQLDNQKLTSNEFPSLPWSTSQNSSFICNGSEGLSFESPTLTAIIYKRRSGLGILSSRAWERRKLVLIGNKLYYFRSDDSAEELKQAASIDGGSHDESKQASMTDDGTDMIASSSSSSTTLLVKKNKDFRQFWEQATQITQNLLQHAEPAFSSMSFSHFDKSNDASIPRGCIDLWKDQAMVALSFAAERSAPVNLGISHSISTNSSSENTALSSPSPQFILSMAHVAPTPFCLTIFVKSELKWKLCFESQQEQSLWLQTLSHIILKGSVKYYNDGLTSVGGSIEGFQFPSVSRKDALWNVDEPITPFLTKAELSSVDETNRNAKVLDQDKEWKDTNYFNSCEKDIGKIRELTASNSVTKDTELRDETYMNLRTVFGNERRMLEYFNPNILLTFTNMVLIFIYLSSLSWISFVTLLIVLNSLIFPISFTQKLISLWYGYNESKEHKEVPEIQEEPLSPKVNVSKELDWTFKPRAGSTMTRTSISPCTTDSFLCSWRSLSFNHILVRSFGYNLSKKKIPAPYALYEPVHIDLFKSSRRIGEIATKVTLPQLSENSNKHPWKSPDWFVVSLAVPTETPKLTRPNNDGAGLIATVYYSMKAETKEILRHITSDTFNSTGYESELDVQMRRYNGVRLFEEWCAKAPMDSQMQGRFKFIPNIDNLAEVGIPSWISRWCGKPTLIKRKGITGFLYSWDIDQARIMEFDISFHPFPYLAKSAAAFLLKDGSWCKKFLASCSFVIEGRCDDELPEILIGDPIQVCNLDPMTLTDAEDVFSLKRS